MSDLWLPETPEDVRRNLARARALNDEQVVRAARRARQSAWRGLVLPALLLAIVALVMALTFISAAGGFRG